MSTQSKRLRRLWRSPRRTVKATIAVLVGTVAVAVPYAWASDRFTDVSDSNPHHDDINIIAGAGITAGCSPTTFCPSDAVTRQQMGSFLARTLRAATPAFRVGVGFTGALDPDANEIACATPELSPTVAAKAIVQGYVNLKQDGAGELGYRVIPTVSDDGGATWTDLPAQFHTFATSFASGAWTSAPQAFSLPEIGADLPNRWGLRVARESGTTDASDKRCRIWLVLHYADAGPSFLD
jgi:S-layer homology domain